VPSTVDDSEAGMYRSQRRASGPLHHRDYVSFLVGAIRLRLTGLLGRGCLLSRFLGCGTLGLRLLRVRPTWRPAPILVLFISFLLDRAAVVTLITPVARNGNAILQRLGLWSHQASSRQGNWRKRVFFYRTRQKAGVISDYRSGEYGPGYF
jgi:hypothetical protein